jgi:hypothetical protein
MTTAGHSERSLQSEGCLFLADWARKRRFYLADRLRSRSVRLSVGIELGPLVEILRVAKGAALTITAFNTARWFLSRAVLTGRGDAFAFGYRDRLPRRDVGKLIDLATGPANFQRISAFMPCEAKGQYQFMC